MKSNPYILPLFLAILFSAVISTAQVKPAFTHLQNFDKIRDFTMNKAGNEAFFTIQSPLEEISMIAKVTKSNNWSKPEILPFSGKYKDLEPFLSPNNLKLYFASNRPTSENDSIQDFDIWYVERKSVKGKWSLPKHPGFEVNSPDNEFYPSVSSAGNLYFTSDRKGGKGLDDLYFSSYNDGVYSTPVSMSESINTERHEYNAFISADEKYIIFGSYNRKDGMGSGDIYISFMNDSGGWEPAINMGSTINSVSMDYCPFYHEGSKTLYFTSRRSSISTEKAIKGMDDLESLINQYENGYSRIYKMLLNLDDFKDQ